MNQYTKRQQKRGFTLIEVLLSMMILSLALLPVSHGFILTIRNNETLHARTAAIRKAQTAMEISTDAIEVMTLSELDVALDISVANLEKEIYNRLISYAGTEGQVKVHVMSESSPFIKLVSTATEHNSEVTFVTLKMSETAPWLYPSEHRVWLP